MKIIIECEAKEIADLVLAVKDRQDGVDVSKIINRIHEEMEESIIETNNSYFF